MRNIRTPDSRGATVGEALGLTFVSVIAAFAVVEILRRGITVMGIGNSTALQIFLQTQVHYGFLLVALGYLAVSSSSSRFLQFHMPSFSDACWLIVLLALIPVTSSARGDWFLTEPLRTTPTLWIAVFVCWFLVTAPAEELLFRGIIQGRLGERFRAPVAVLLAAGLFALMHVAFAVSQGESTLLSRGLIMFVMGAVFGTVYDRTNNLVIPAVGHATYWLSPALLYYI